MEQAEQEAKERRIQQQKRARATASVPEEKTEEDWFTKRSKELVERIREGKDVMQAEAKEAENEYTEAVRAMQKAQEGFLKKSKELQGAMANALQKALEHGEARSVAKLYAKISDGTTPPAEPSTKAMPRPESKKMPHQKPSKRTSGKGEKDTKYKSMETGKVQPPEEDPGMEWRERYYEDEWPTSTKIRSTEKYPKSKFEPFRPEWEKGLQDLLLELAFRGFGTNKDGERVPTRPFPWSFSSKQDFRRVENLLQAYAVRLIEKCQEAKGRGRSMEAWHLHPVGRGRMDREKTTRDGKTERYSILGTLPPSRNMCRSCWMEGHWQGGCKADNLAYRVFEPAVVVLEPAQKIRKFWPVRNIVRKDQDSNSNHYEKYFATLCLLDFGALDWRISEINKGFRTAKARDPDAFPVLEPAEVEAPSTSEKPKDIAKVVDLEAPEEGRKDKEEKPKRKPEEEAQKEELRKKLAKHSQAKIQEEMDKRSAAAKEKPQDTEEPDEEDPKEESTKAAAQEEKKVQKEESEAGNDADMEESDDEDEESESEADDPEDKEVGPEKKIHEDDI